MCGAFFKEKPILKSTHRTFISLIPKNPTATDMSDFRQISCVNLMHKLMTKMIADKLSKLSSELISPNQTTFIEGIHISYNTMLAEEMVYGFCRKRTPKRCCLSIDLSNQEGLSYSQVGGHSSHSGSIWLLPPSSTKSFGTLYPLLPSQSQWKALPPHPSKTTKESNREIRSHSSYLIWLWMCLVVSQRERGRERDLGEEI